MDKIDVIDRPSDDAVTGHAAIQGGGSLDKPGPFNNIKTGGVRNVHQIHFHLSGGNLDKVTPHRWVKRTVQFGEGKLGEVRDEWPLPDGVGVEGGVEGTKFAEDGPQPHEVQRRGKLLSVADGPGVPGDLGKGAEPYPFIYDARFVLKAMYNSILLATVRYRVYIFKKDGLDIPNQENEVKEVKIYKVSVEAPRRNSLDLTEGT